MKNKSKIGIVGLWHLGCVLSAVWSKKGFEVIGFDYSIELIRGLNNGNPPIFEKGLAKTINYSIAKNKLKFTNDIKKLADCDFVFIAYDSTVLEDDSIDLTNIIKSMDSLIEIIKQECILIISSQMPVGACEKLRIKLRNKQSNAELVYSPENLRLGDAINCYLNPDRIILGGKSDSALSNVKKLFSRFNTHFLITSFENAEMIKHATNSFLANLVVLGNHLADLCEVVHADIFEVIEGIKTDPRMQQNTLCQYLYPGIGFSGGTLARDLQILAKTNEAARKKADLFRFLLDSNKNRKEIICEKIYSLANGISGKTISILGLTYKPGTSTLRRSLPLEIANTLSEDGANIQAYDPMADYNELKKKPKFKICTSIDEAITGSELIVILTNWDEFKKCNWVIKKGLLHNNRIFDPKGQLYDLDLTNKGYEYYRIGG